jgi:hypothetical protein
MSQRLEPGTALHVPLAGLRQGLDALDRHGLGAIERAVLLEVLARLDPWSGCAHGSVAEITAAAGLAPNGGKAKGALKRLAAAGLLMKTEKGWLLNPLLAHQPAGPERALQRWARFRAELGDPARLAGYRVTRGDARARHRDLQARQRAEQKLAKATATEQQPEPLPAAA